MAERKTIIIKKPGKGGGGPASSTSKVRASTQIVVPTVCQTEPVQASARGDKGALSAGAERVTRIQCAQCQNELDVGHIPPFTEFKCPACNTQQIVPAKFDNFLLLGKLGAGGMGIIYRAKDGSLGRFVALKVMNKAMSENDEQQQSFKREAQAAAALNHRNVVQIYSFGQVGGQAYIAMELMSGGRLDKMLENGQRLDELTALTVHLEAAEGLKAAADAGLLHGDVKPANVLFGQQKEAKIVDFGLACFVDKQQQTGQIWGTPYYIAPEKVRGKAVDFRSDIYSLGATLFHALTGQPPFDGNTPTDVVVARLNQPAPSLTKFRDDLHPETLALVARMLEAEPASRYPSYEALLVDMRAALAAAKQPLKKAGGKSGVFKAGGQGRSKIDRKKILIAAAVVAAVGLSVGVGVLIKNHRAEQRRLAAERQEQEALAVSQMRMREIWTRLSDLTRGATNALAAAEALAVEIKNITADSRVAKKYAGQAAQEVEKMLAVTGAVASVQTNMNRIRQALDLATQSSAHKALVTELEALTNTLFQAQAALKESREDAERALKHAVEAQKHEQEESEKQRLAEAEEAARKKEEEARARAERAQAEEEARQRRQAAARELERLEATRAANGVWVEKKQYDEAAKAMTKQMAGLETPEAQAYAKTCIDAYAALGKLKLFIVKSIRPETPCLGVWAVGESRRNIVKADAEAGLTIALGGTATTMAPWPQVTAPQLVKIADYYLNANQALTDAERADVRLELALLCYESCELKAAEAYLKQAEAQAAEACRVNPDLRAEAERFMPGLLAP